MKVIKRKKLNPMVRTSTMITVQAMDNVEIDVNVWGDTQTGRGIFEGIVTHTIEDYDWDETRFLGEVVNPREFENLFSNKTEKKLFKKKYQDLVDEVDAAVEKSMENLYSSENVISPESLKKSKKYILNSNSITRDNDGCNYVIFTEDKDLLEHYDQLWFARYLYCLNTKQIATRMEVNGKSVYTVEFL